MGRAASNVLCKRRGFGACFVRAASNLLCRPRWFGACFGRAASTVLFARRGLGACFGSAPSNVFCKWCGLSACFGPAASNELCQLNGAVSVLFIYFSLAGHFSFFFGFWAFWPDRRPFRCVLEYASSGRTSVCADLRLGHQGRLRAWGTDQSHRKIGPCKQNLAIWQRPNQRS